MKPPLIKSIKLKEIEIAELQARAATDDKTIDEYAEAFQVGEKFPPAVVFHDGKLYFLADGFHRYFGAKQAGLNDLLCDVRSGTRKDALWFAVGANRTHGLKRTNADKRNAAAMAVHEHPEMSDRLIAEHIGVSNSLVSEIRKSISTTVEKVSSDDTSTVGNVRKHAIPPPIIRPAPVISKPPVSATSKPPLPPPPVIKKKSAAPIVTPEKVEVLDKTGHPVHARLLPLWEHADQVASVLLAKISDVRGLLRQAEKDKDKAFVEMSFGKVQAELDNAYTELKTVKPHAVCTACKGLTPDNCQLCRGKGFISEFRWNTVSKETKEMRAKGLRK